MDSWLDLHRYRTADLVREAAVARDRRLTARREHHRPARTPRLTTTYR